MYEKMSSTDEMPLEPFSFKNGSFSNAKSNHLHTSIYIYTSFAQKFINKKRLGRVTGPFASLLSIVALLL